MIYVFKKLTYHFASLFHMKRREKAIVQFIVGYEGISGGSEAIANIANNLCRDFNVFVAIGPLSNFNLWLSLKVRRGIKNGEIDFLIIDRSAGLKEVELVANRAKVIICSVHGFNRTAHGIKQDFANINIKYADVVHFVSEHQRADFEGEYKQSVVIPNHCSALADRSGPFDIGMVGMFDNPAKNLELMIAEIEKLANVRAIIWGRLTKEIVSNKVHFSGYSTNKDKVFSSFKVLLSLSLNETFGMVVIQAISAGKPCVLSSIDAHKMYEKCPGVFLVDPSNSEQIMVALRAAITMSGNSESKQKIKDYWQTLYNENSVKMQWLSFLSRIRDHER